MRDTGTMSGLAVPSVDAFVYGRAPHPVRCGHGLAIGEGRVVPEINFTLAGMDIDESSFPAVRREYKQMIAATVARAEQLHSPELLVEFETLPPMTVRPEWGLEITGLLAEELAGAAGRSGLKCALRLTPNDVREFERPPLMRRGRYLEAMLQLFDGAGAAGADLVSIESTGGKELCDEALMTADLRGVVFALGVLGCRDMRYLWDVIVERCRTTDVIPAGDTACGFANTAMVLAEKGMIPRVFAAMVRVAAVPRSLAAFTAGAIGPSKDCAYEGPYIKAMTGAPISMEGKSAACAHLSPVGNIGQALCDCWSNESVQNVRLLSDSAPVVSVEQLVYDCRLMNAARGRGEENALRLRDWLADSDAGLDPQAYVLRPDVVYRIAGKLIEEPDPYAQTVRAVRCAVEELKAADRDGLLRIGARERPWLERMEAAMEEIPETEGEMIEAMLPEIDRSICDPGEYGIEE